MNARAAAIAGVMVESRLFVGRTNARESVIDWIDEAAAEDVEYLAARASFNELTEAKSEANFKGHCMAAEFARAAYLLGVQVGLRLRIGHSEASVVVSPKPRQQRKRQDVG